MSGGWIAVDLDGTLAGWGDAHGTDILTIGPPIPRMVEKVKRWLADGQAVRIFTARVGPASEDECTRALNGISVVDLVARCGKGVLHLPTQLVWEEFQRRLIADWCQQHLGQTLPVTATKDFHMIALYDDRCVQIVTNQGREALDGA